MNALARSALVALALGATTCGAPQRPAPACPIVRPARSSLCDDTSGQSCAYRDPDGCYMRCTCASERERDPRRWICESSCGRAPE